MRHDVSLNDRYDLEKSTVLLNGTQALVRLMMMQKARDTEAGLNTAGYVTGYRGSPLGNVDFQMQRAAKELGASDVTFQAGLNEDLAATALWGTQQAELRGEGTHDGVFGMWYGKGPGVDRSGDVFRHANMAGTSVNGGVLACMGDDHTGESSTTLHQSEFAMVDAMIPILSPAGVQEILDYGVLGYALSRFSGCWVGLKCMKDTVEVTSVVEADPYRVDVVLPEIETPEGGLNIRLVDDRVEQEARLLDYKKNAVEVFGFANKIDQRKFGISDAKIGIVAAGKNWLDVAHALELLGIDEDEATRLGITTYKVGMVWPLDRRGFNDWADKLDLVIVVEEKRKLLEPQIKETLFDDLRGRRVVGAKDGAGVELFPERYALNPVMIAQKLAGLFVDEGLGNEKLAQNVETLNEAQRADNAEEISTRVPYFCSGCPHNTSTKIPEGSRAYAGIGCHYMAQWMDRETLGYTHMGGEGANWIGESLFSTTDHVFQNVGDGTYNHSGVQAIRAALAAKTNVTYKILFNDAVAMTGGQSNDGGLTGQQITHELRAMGVKHVAAIYDEKEDLDMSAFPKDIDLFTRDRLNEAQEKYRDIKGVSAIVYIQTCAAEKRRRRKRGAFPDPDKRIFINPDVCEGCGDCGVQSNCVSIIPLETPLGRKRAIDQSTCNKDFSCIQGFCPSFVTLEGAQVKKMAAAAFDLPDVPLPKIPGIEGTYNVVITGVGGTGVVTLGSGLAMAAHLEGKGAGVMEMAGLAQKGGAVHIHCRFANTPAEITAVRVATGEADAVIGGDLVVTSGAATLGLMAQGRTQAVVNSHETITGDFTRDTQFSLPSDRMALALQARIGASNTLLFDSTALSKKLLGNSIHSNVIVMGAAFQNGLLPMSHDAFLEMFDVFGNEAETNKRAFEIGRWAAHFPEEASRVVLGGTDEESDTGLDFETRGVEHLTEFQDAKLGARYRQLIESVSDPELRTAVAEGYLKLLAYKDEYEVARLHLKSTEALVAQSFDGDIRMKFHLAPPLLSRKGPDGRPKKIRFGPWVLNVFKVLTRLKRLRGTPFDIFGYTSERKMERALIKQYEADISTVLSSLTPATHDIAVSIARLPLDINGYGPVKLANVAKVAKRREELLAAYETGGSPHAQAAE